MNKSEKRRFKQAVAAFIANEIRNIGELNVDGSLHPINVSPFGRLDKEILIHVGDDQFIILIKEYTYGAVQRRS